MVKMAWGVLSRIGELDGMSVGPEWLGWNGMFCPELENWDRMSVGPEWLRLHGMFCPELENWMG